MPLGLRRPLVVGVLPRPLRRNGQNGELFSGKLFRRSCEYRARLAARRPQPVRSKTDV